MENNFYVNDCKYQMSAVQLAKFLIDKWVVSKDFIQVAINCDEKS